MQEVVDNTGGSKIVLPTYMCSELLDECAVSHLHQKIADTCTISKSVVDMLILKKYVVDICVSVCVAVLLEECTLCKISIWFYTYKFITYF